MRKSLLAAAAIAAVLAIATPAGGAAAMPIATADQLGLADSSGMEKTVLICGPWRCFWRPNYWGGWYGPGPYWGWRRHYWWGWHRPGLGWRRPGWGWRRW
jgi:hypothetical protein